VVGVPAVVEVQDGPFGSDFRYIGDTGTYLARYAIEFSPTLRRRR
jgi:hypothetical protein